MCHSFQPVLHLLLCQKMLLTLLFIQNRGRVSNSRSVFFCVLKPAIEVTFLKTRMQIVARHLCGQVATGLAGSLLEVSENKVFSCC